jgi:2-succinyl-5-enolpyruvyl-6-hydroxy-3-cyclohexene-1-carboxylate synthase
VAALYGLDYERPTTLAELQAAVEHLVGGEATTIIEVRTDREQNLALHQRVAEAVRAAI